MFCCGCPNLKRGQIQPYAMPTKWMGTKKNGRNSLCFCSRKFNVCLNMHKAQHPGMLGRYQSNSRLDHWKATKKVMRYLQGIKDYMLTFKRSDNLEVIGYSDSDFAGCVDNRKSTFGYLFMLAGGAISWKGKLSMLHPLWELNLQNFILGPGIVNSISKPLRIYCDNFAALFFSKNNKYSNGAKHIELKYLNIKEEV